MKRKTLIISILCTTIFVLGGTPLALSLSNIIHTNIIDDDYKFLKNNENYKTPYLIEGIDLVKQDISCGYAVMEMFGDFSNQKISEEDLYKNNNNKIVTSSISGFEKEMNKVFTNYKTKSYSWLKSSVLIEKCYQSLKNGIPVPLEMAYQLNGEWTLHFSLLIGIDILKDEFRILNPYGKDELLTMDEFILHTTYKSWSNMPFYLSWAFGLTVFDKNTIFLISKKRSINTNAININLILN